MSSSKIIGYEIYKEGEINGDRFLEFLQKNLKNTKNKVIILDNTSSHKNKQIKDFITKNNSLLTQSLINKEPKQLKVFLMR